MPEGSDVHEEGVVETGIDTVDTAANPSRRRFLQFLVDAGVMAGCGAVGWFGSTRTIDFVRELLAEEEVQPEEEPAETVDTNGDTPLSSGNFRKIISRYSRKLGHKRCSEISGRIYEGGKLVDNVADSFDKYFAESKIKKFLDQSGNSKFFRDTVVYGLVTIESAWNINAVSSVGAQGLFQIMPGTNRRLAQGGYLPAPIDPYTPAQAAQACVALFDFHLNYLMDNIGSSFVFHSPNVRPVLIPMLLMSYNQGQERLVNMAGFLTDLHKKGVVPDNCYVDKKTPIFNEDAVVFLFDRAFALVKTSQITELTEADETFKNNNRGFGPHGKHYAFKAIGHAEAFVDYLKKHQK